ncbi:MAG: TonB-dependent receptor [Pseudomonadota bacterium]
MRKTSASLIALGVASGFASPLAAQSNPATGATDEEGNTIVVTASRSGEAVDVKDVPASVTVISNEDLQKRQTRIVSDVLRDVPGVAVNRTGAIGGQTQVRIRGTEGNHVLVLIDGIEVASPFLGEFDFGTLIADEAARIEVLRGQQSSLYGSDAIGGVIQYITLTGRDAPGVSVRAEGGSFGTFTGGARAAGYTDTLDYVVTASIYETGGFPTARDGNRDLGSTSIGASGKLTWSPTDNFTLTGVGRYSLTDADTNNSENDPTSPLFGLIVDSPGVTFENEAFYGLVRAELSALDGRWTNALTGQFSDTRREEFNANGFASGNDGTRYKGSFESSIRFGSERFVNRITVAVDYEREEFQNLTPGGFAFTGRRSVENWGFVGQYEAELDNALFLGASIRRDENNRFDDVTTYRLQAGYRLPFGLRVRGAYGTGIKNPGFFELFGFSDGRFIGNPDLQPEESEGFEVGLDYEIAQGAASIGATYFDSTLDGEIFTTSSAPSFITTPANRTTESTQRGVEVFANAQPIPQLRFDLAYTYLDAEENGVTEVRRPEHVASFNTTALSSDEKFSGTLTIRYNGEQDDVTFTDPTFVTTPIVTLAEYVLVNLNAEYRVADNVTIFGRIENLLDEDYEEVFSFATPGRGAYAGVRASF